MHKYAAHRLINSLKASAMVHGLQMITMQEFMLLCWYSFCCSKEPQSRSVMWLQIIVRGGAPTCRRTLLVFTADCLRHQLADMILGVYHQSITLQIYSYHMCRCFLIRRWHCHCYILVVNTAVIRTLCSSFR